MNHFSRFLFNISILITMYFRDQFKSTEDRDNFLKREVRMLSRQIEETEEQVKEVDRSLEDEQRETEHLNQQIAVRIELFLF